MLQNTSQTAELFKTISTENRLRTLLLLDEGKNLDDVADELGIRRASIYPYLNDFQEQGLVMKEGDGLYITTDKAEVLMQWLPRFEQLEKLDQEGGTGVSKNDFEQLPGVIEEKTGVPSDNIHIQVNIEKEEDETGPNSVQQESENDSDSDTGSMNGIISDALSEADSSREETTLGAVGSEEMEKSVAVRITEDLGKIKGVDGNNYDLEEGDVVALPAMNAEALIQHDAAENIDTDDKAILGG